MRDDKANRKPSRDVVHRVIRVLRMKHDSAIEIHRQFTDV
jgi:hypothetical protein